MGEEVLHASRPGSVTAATPAAWVRIVCFAACLLLPARAAAHADLDEQVAALSARIAAHPQKGELYLDRGEVHALRQDWDAAMADYERAASLDPKLSAVYLARGRVFHHAGWLHAAEAALDAFLAREPGHPVGLAARARVKEDLGRHLEAAEDYDRAIAEARHPPPEFYLARAAALAAAGNAHLDRALQGLDEGIERLGFVGTLVLCAVDLEAGRERYDEALVRLDALIDRSSRKERWLARRGEILETMGDTKRAREAYTASLKAIDNLPVRRRRTQVMADLEERVRTSLDRLDAHH